MGLLSRWIGKNTELPTAAPDLQAREEVLNREIARLGRDEVVRRLVAVSEYRAGRTRPSGFESWNQQLEMEIINLTHRLMRDRFTPADD